MRGIKFRAWNDIIGMVNNPRLDVVLGKEECEKYKVMQFTGLKDKNGKEIYEEDIIKDKNGIIWTVHFIMGRFGIYCSAEEMAKAVKTKNKNKTEEDEIADDLDAWWYGTEIIGNTYENSELLNKMEVK